MKPQEFNNLLRGAKNDPTARLILADALEEFRFNFISQIDLCLTIIRSGEMRLGRFSEFQERQNFEHEEGVEVDVVANWAGAGPTTYIDWDEAVHMVASHDEGATMESGRTNDKPALSGGWDELVYRTEWYLVDHAENGNEIYSRDCATLYNANSPRNVPGLINFLLIQDAGWRKSVNRVMLVDTLKSLGFG